MTAIATVSRVPSQFFRDFHSKTKDNQMTKKIKKKQSRTAEVRSPYPATTSAGGTGEHDGAWEDMDYNGEERDGPKLDSEEEMHEVAQAAPEKTTKLLRKKKKHRKKGNGDSLHPAEDGDFERPRKRHKLRSSGDASPGYSRMPSCPATAEDSSRSSSSSSPEPELEPPQTPLDHRTLTPTPPAPPPTLQRFPLPSRPHAPEKSELASQGLDRALASAQLVDPLLSTPLSPDDGNDDDITGLSARTLRRLRDLGIVELFAGVLFLSVASGDQ